MIGYSVLAMITTFNPDIYLLSKNIDAVKSQVDKVLIYENASDNRSDIIHLCNEKSIDFVLNNVNEGVAGPLHDGVEYAFSNGYDFIFTLDQDSVASENMIKNLVDVLQSDDKIAMVGGTMFNPEVVRGG